MANCPTASISGTSSPSSDRGGPLLAVGVAVGVAAAVGCRSQGSTGSGPASPLGAFGFNFPTLSLPCAPHPNITNWDSLVTLADVSLGRKIPTNRDSESWLWTVSPSRLQVSKRKEAVNDAGSLGRQEKSRPAAHLALTFGALVSTYLSFLIYKMGAALTFKRVAEN